MKVRCLMKPLAIALLAMSLTACSDEASDEEQELAPFGSTYQPADSGTFAITNAKILTGTGEYIESGTVLVSGGKITAVGTDLDVDDETTTLDAGGKWITPGIIDTHSHLGVYPAPGVESSADGNEATSPNTAEVWAEHSVWPQDPQFSLALAGGITSMQILPGSANLFGGRSVTVKNVQGRSVMDMKFPDAPYGLKMACGENPKRVYGGQGRSPGTRMGNVAGYRAAWIKAADYKKKWDGYKSAKENGGGGEAPGRDLKLETLAGVLSGDILVHNHCYRADEMVVMMDIAKEFGYKISSFHHAIESYKIADLLAENDVCSSMWADWWGFKQEAYDATRENVAMVEAAGACAIVHSDSAVGTQHLNQEAAKAMAAGNKAGIDIKPEVAIQWITLNPAKSMGIADQTGSLESGKMADIVLWDGNPFSVYSKAERVYIDGNLMYDRLDPSKQPVSDFDLGILDAAGERL